jgi:hypothetical protein
MAPVARDQLAPGINCATQATSQQQRLMRIDHLMRANLADAVTNIGTKTAPVAQGSMKHGRVCKGARMASNACK